MANAKLVNQRAILELAQSAGFRSIRQLDVFLFLAPMSPISLHQATGLLPTDPVYRNLYNIVRKLGSGSPSRDYDGIDVFVTTRMADYSIHHKDYLIDLTAKGKKLAQKMSIL